MALDFITFINSNTKDMTAQKKADMLSDFCENFGAVGLSTAEQVAFANERIQSFIVQCVEETRKVRAERAMTIERLIIK